MADFTPPGDQILNAAREILERANEVAENEERLGTLGGFQETLRSIEHKTEDDEENEAVCSRKKRAVEHTCKHMISGDFIPVLAEKAVLSDTIREINKVKLQAKEELPEHMVIKINDAAHDLKKIDELFIPIDERVLRMKTKIDEVMRLEEKDITEAEKNSLEWDSTLLERELAACKKYLEDAKEAIDMLISDIYRDFAWFGFGAGLLFLATCIAGYVSKMALFSRNAITATGKELLTGGLSAGASCLTGGALGWIIHAATSRRKLLNKHLAEIESLRRKVKLEYERRNTSFDYLMEDKEKLKVD